MCVSKQFNKRLISLASYVLWIIASLEHNVFATPEDFDRLFTTAGERNMLDRARHGGKIVTRIAPKEKGKSNVVVADPTRVTLSGYVLRADGKSTVWVDGQSALNPQAQMNAVVGRPLNNSRKVPVHARRRSTLLKPGPVWLLDEKRIEESYRVAEPMEKEAETKTTEDISDAPEKDIVGKEEASE